MFHVDVLSTQRNLLVRRDDRDPSYGLSSTPMMLSKTWLLPSLAHSWDVDMYIQLFSGPIWVSSYKFHSTCPKLTIFSWISGSSFCIPHLFQLMAPQYSSCPPLTAPANHHPKPYPLARVSHSIKGQILLTATFWVLLQPTVMYAFIQYLAALARPGPQCWEYWNAPGGPKEILLVIHFVSSFSVMPFSPGSKH